MPQQLSPPYSSSPPLLCPSLMPFDPSSPGMSLPRCSHESTFLPLLHYLNHYHLSQILHLQDWMQYIHSRLKQIRLGYKCRCFTSRWLAPLVLDTLSAMKCECIFAWSEPGRNALLQRRVGILWTKESSHHFQSSTRILWSHQAAAICLTFRTMPCEVVLQSALQDQ